MALKSNSSGRLTSPTLPAGDIYVCGWFLWETTPVGFASLFGVDNNATFFDVESTSGATSVEVAPAGAPTTILTTPGTQNWFYVACAIPAANGANVPAWARQKNSLPAKTSMTMGGARAGAMQIAAESTGAQLGSATVGNVIVYERLLRDEEAKAQAGYTAPLFQGCWAWLDFMSLLRVGKDRSGRGNNFTVTGTWVQSSLVPPVPESSFPLAIEEVLSAPSALTAFGHDQQGTSANPVVVRRPAAELATPGLLNRTVGFEDVLVATLPAPRRVPTQADATPPLVNRGAGFEALRVATLPAPRRVPFQADAATPVVKQIAGFDPIVVSTLRAPARAPVQADGTPSVAGSAPAAVAVDVVACPAPRAASRATTTAESAPPILFHLAGFDPLIVQTRPAVPRPSVPTEATPPILFAIAWSQPSLSPNPPTVRRAAASDAFPLLPPPWWSDLAQPSPRPTPPKGSSQPDALPPILFHLAGVDPVIVATQPAPRRVPTQADATPPIVSPRGGFDALIVSTLPPSRRVPVQADSTPPITFHLGGLEPVVVQTRPAPRQPPSLTDPFPTGVVVPLAKWAQDPIGPPVVQVRARQQPTDTLPPIVSPRGGYEATGAPRSTTWQGARQAAAEAIPGALRGWAPDGATARAALSWAPRASSPEALPGTLKPWTQDPGSRAPRPAVQRTLGTDAAPSAPVRLGGIEQDTTFRALSRAVRSAATDAFAVAAAPVTGWVQDYEPPRRALVSWPRASDSLGPSVTLFVFGPISADRIIVVAADGRIISVAFDDRSAIAAADPRAALVPDDERDVNTPADSRTLIVPKDS